MGVGREVLKRSVLKTETVDMPEWGGPVILREMSAAQVVEFNRFARAVSDDEAGADMRRAAWTVVTCWVDEAGDQILSEEDAPILLATQTSTLIIRLSLRALVLSGMLPGRALEPGEKYDAGAVAEKNSESSQSAESGIT
jgi:hypothetical protein